MKLPKRFLIVPVVIAAFSFLLYSAYKDVKDRTLNEFNAQQFTLAKQASRGIESFFIYYQRELQFLSRLKFVSELNDQGRELLADFYTNNSDQIEGITVVDSKGILKYTFPLNKDVIGQDISNQDHIKKVIETHEPTVSDVFTSVQGFKTIAYHVPIIIDNEYKGSIAILIPLAKLGKRFVENIRTGETGYGWMISEFGIELYNPSDNLTGISAKEIFKNEPAVLDLINRTKNEKEGTSILPIFPKETGKNDTSTTLAAFYRVPLGNTFWTIIIFTPENEVYSKLTSFQNRLYILLSLIFIVIGTYFYLSFKASNILKEEKKRRAIEKTLTESEKRFRVMFELSPAGIILIDEKGTIIEVNSSFCETLGYSRNEIIRKNIRLFASPENEEEIESNISNILSGKTMIQEVRNIRKDGTSCIAALYETRIILPDGTTGILSVSNDITEKKRSQERMLTLSRALESIGECVSITDTKNKILFVNNAFCRTYGYSEEEIIGRDISIVRSSHNHEYPAEKILSDTIDGRWIGELINVRKDGSEFPIELSTSHIKDEKGNSIALIGIAVDITERKKVQQELINAKEKAEESDRLKSSFLATMSHELRTPLNAIIGFSGLLIDSNPDQNTTSYSQIILKSGQHLLSLVEDIFDITMIETERVKINYEKINIISALEEVRDIIHGERLMENKTAVELKLNLESAGNEKFLVTDGRKLKQVLMNLLRNALKFTEKGSIEFGFKVINDALNNCFQFYVRDTGIGIDKKYHEAIFNMFRQIDDTHTRRFGGMGIGLSIAKRTVEILGGKIWVESELSKGSVFCFTIPLVPDYNEKKERSEDNALNIKKEYTGKTILIAEDEQSNFDFLKILFTRMNIRILWAKDGFEAVDLCQTDPTINLVLMDIKMPLLNGYEATKMIKKIRPELPVIAQTAYAMISDRQEAEKAGCDGYLSKPIKIKQIMEVLDNFL
jgi:PAS domain S-box-containing protein